MEAVQEEIQATGHTPANGNCLDVTEENNPLCFGNVTWAMVTGVKTNPKWYAEYPILAVNNSFSAYQFVLAEKVGLGDGIDDGRGWSCPYPCSMTVPSCAVITEDSPGECYQNVLWAKTTGIKEKPAFYAAYAGLTENSSFNDFQFALNDMLGPNQNGTGWQCPAPCTSTFITTTTAAVTTSEKDLVISDSTSLSSSTTVSAEGTGFSWTTTPAKVGTEGDEGSGFPWYGYLLLGGLLLLCCAGIAYAYMNFGKKGGAKKAKRSVKKAKPPALAPAVQETSYTAPAATTYTAAPIYTAAPMAAPVYTAAPTTRMAAPAPAMAAPAPAQYVATPQVQMRAVQATATPMLQATPVPMQATAMPAVSAVMPAYTYGGTSVQQAASLFDQLDANHDGTITRAEFARLMRQ
jgi:hypothetical protein